MILIRQITLESWQSSDEKNFNLGQFILASESPRRKEILNNIGLNFKVYSSKINETEFKKYSPKISATLCAEKKAETASQNFW